MSAALLDPASEVVVNASPLRRQYDVVHDKPKNVTVNGGEPLSQNSKICAFCASVILDKYLLKICDNFCHETCLLCSFCGQSLAGMPSCFVKEGKIFCKDDYRRIFGAKCLRCMVPLNPTDLVHKSADGVYHATCFICIFCGHLLQPGDEYVVHDGFLVCRLDYEAMVQGAFGPAYKLPSSSNHSDHHRKSPKRPRTILTSQQRKAFKASFELSAKPCRKVREALAKETGLSVRVVQVWFQNQRAKMKKIQRKLEQSQKQKIKNGDQKHHQSNGNHSFSRIKAGYEMKRPDSAASSATSSTDSSSEMSVQSPITDTFDQSYEEDGTNPTTSSMNPIDCLYSMQNTYFNF